MYLGGRCGMGELVSQNKIGMAGSTRRAYLRIKTGCRLTQNRNGWKSLGLCPPVDLQSMTTMVTLNQLE